MTFYLKAFGGTYIDISFPNYRRTSMTAPQEQKLKVTGPVIVTANRLGDGVVIYRTAEGGWSRRLDHAAVVTTASAATELLGASSKDGILAVGAYVAPVVLGPDGQPQPGNLRERIRHGGPTFALPVQPEG